MNIKIELHSHSSASDGVLSPSALIDLAHTRAIRVLALTDHDTTQGVLEAKKRAAKYNITLIPGIELSTVYKGETVHILGYFKDNSYMSKEFQLYLQELQEYRIFRVKKIIENLKLYFDINLDYHIILNSSKGAIGRPHIARAIIAAGYPYSFEYIFKNIISKESKAYVPNKEIQLQQGIDFLKKYGALVVLAHPVLIRKVPFQEVALHSFQGMEVHYPRNSKEDTEKYLSFARENSLLVCGGSDFHAIGDKKHGDLGEISPCLDKEDVKKFLKQMSIEL